MKNTTKLPALEYNKAVFPGPRTYFLGDSVALIVVLRTAKNIQTEEENNK